MSVISVDVGGTKTLVGLYGDDGTLQREHSAPTRVGDDHIATVGQIVSGCLDEWGEVPSVLAAGIPELVDPAGHVVAHEVLTWARQPHDVLTEVLVNHGVHDPIVRIDSDVRLGALGEARFGTGIGLSSFLYVSLGTGLSSTVVIDDRPWQGARGLAIALGEWSSPDPALNLERFASGNGMERRFAAQTGREVDLREIQRLALEGDATALGILDSAGAAIGHALRQMVDVLDPDGIVIGGGLGTAGTLLDDAMRRTYAEEVALHGGPELTLAANGPYAGLIGGYALALAPY